jgi:hypothetical protein
MAHDRDYAQQRRDKDDLPAGGPANRDPITKTPGAHPVGTGIGAAGGGAAGAAIGAVAGPVGAAIGAVAGAVAGGLAGKAPAEAVDPTVEDGYWKDTYKTRPYVAQNVEYKDYQPAYRYGWENAGKYKGRQWGEVENDLARDWAYRRGECKLEWDQARPAVRDAWDRVALRTF